jgi:ribosomal protein S18 acetylase RimI-like enzyme
MQKAVKLICGVMPRIEKMKIVFETKPSEKEIDFLARKSFNYNRSKVVNYAYGNFLIKAINSLDTIIAGIHGQIGCGWLYIASLWVSENHRGNGIGGKLLCLSEKEAIERNCHGAYLYTYSFQSPRFYEKFGYGIFGELEKFCGGHTKYFMKKKLA